MTGVLVVTGATGFVGTHVASLAASDGYTVWAVGREAEPPSALAGSCAEYFSADLTRGWPVPPGAEAVVHLAGLAAVGPSYTRSQEYIEVNSRIMTRMSEALLLDGERPRIVVVSSGAVYMAPPGHVSLSEAHAVQPTSPYAVAKLLVEHQASYYAARGLDTVIARPFNHIGPGQSSGFLLPDLATELLALAPGKALATGNIDTARDYTDVRDVARAYLTLAAAPTHAHHIYNVASGTPRSGREMLNALAESLQRDVPQTVTDPARLRPNDAPRIAGDSTRIREEFGWRPNIPWQQSVHDYVAGMPPYLPV